MPPSRLLLRHASAAAEERHSHQENLFGAGDALAGASALPQVVDWPVVERLQQEFAAIGFYLSSHPLDAYGKSLARIGAVRFAELPERLAAGGSTRFRLAGIVIGRKDRTSAEGRRFAFVADVGCERRLRGHGVFRGAGAEPAAP